jgi:hypothetical protein
MQRDANPTLASPVLGRLLGIVTSVIVRLRTRRRLSPR